MTTGPSHHSRQRCALRDDVRTIDCREGSRCPMKIESCLRRVHRMRYSHVQIEKNVEMHLQVSGAT
jgi:hypothetical protein